MSAKWSISFLSKTPMAPYMDIISMAVDNTLGEKLAINIATMRTVYAPCWVLERWKSVVPKCTHS